MAAFEHINQRVAVDVIGGIAVLRSKGANGGGEVGLADAGRAQEDDILGVLQEAHGSQFQDLALVNGGLETEVEVLKGLAHGDAGHADLVLVGAAALAGSLLREDVIQHFDDVQIILHGPLQVVVQGRKGALHLQDFQVVLDALVEDITHDPPPPPRRRRTGRCAGWGSRRCCPRGAACFQFQTAASR